MSERCLSKDYEIGGVVYEVWVDRVRHWWLVQGDSQVEPELTDKQIEEIGRYVDDALTPDT